MSAEEYRKRVYKEVTVPSGFKFTIRKMNFKVLSALMQVYGETPTGELTEKQRAELGEKIKTKMAQIIEIVIPACVVKPKVRLATASKDELLLDDIEPNDLLFLVNSITEFSGLTGEAAKERKTFQ